MGVSGAGGGGGDANDRLRQDDPEEPPWITGLAIFLSPSVLSSEVLVRRERGEGAR